MQPHSKRKQINALLDILASSVGSFTNPLKLSNIFKSVANIAISDKTVSNFIGYMKDAFLVEKSRRGKCGMIKETLHLFNKDKAARGIVLTTG